MLCWITFYVTIFLKNNYGKSYSTFNLNFFFDICFVMSSASGADDRRPRTILSKQTTNVKKRSPNWKWNNFFQQSFLGKWLSKMWFRIERRITFVFNVFTAIEVRVILIYRSCGNSAADQWASNSFTYIFYFITQITIRAPAPKKSL